MIFASEMPEINLEYLATQLSSEDFELARGIVATQGKNKGRLRAAKPKVAKKVKLEGSEYRFGFSFQYENEQDAKTGMTAYIWRHVCFYTSPIREHQSMPTMDFCDLPGQYNDEQRELAKRLEQIAAIVVDTVPVEKQYGTLNWGKAFGMF